MRKKTIGVVSTWTGLSASLFEAAKEHDYSVLFHILESETIDHSSDLLKDSLDAYIFVSPAGPSIVKLAEKIYLSGKPVLVVLRESEVAPVMAVGSSSAVVDVVDYLAQLGHRDILFVTGTNNEQGRNRLEGYWEGLKRNEIPRNDELVLDAVNFTSARVSKLMYEWLAKGITATAAIFANRQLTVNGVSALKLHGIRVPEDLAVVSVDEPSVGPEWIWDISCWRLPMGRMGRMAVECIAEQFENPKIKPERIGLKFERMIRKSCGAGKLEPSAAKRSNFQSNPIFDKAPPGIAPISYPEAQEIGDWIMESLQNPDTLTDNLHRQINQLELLGMDPKEGFSIILKCYDYCMENRSQTAPEAYRIAFNRAMRMRAKWLIQTHNRIQKERIGLTRDSLFFPDTMSYEKAPTALVDGLKRQLIPRGATKFFVQLLWWDGSRDTFYQWEHSGRMIGDQPVEEILDLRRTPDLILQHQVDRGDYGLFDLSEDKSMRSWLLVKMPAAQLPAIREIANQFEGGIRAFNAFAREHRKLEEFDAARIEAEEARRKFERARATAENAMTVKDRFLANMSHEMRTPMNGVLGITDILLAEDLRTLQKDWLRLIKESGAEIMPTIDDVLDFSEIEAGNLVLESIRFDLRKELDSILLEYHQRAQAKSLQVLCRVDLRTPCSLTGDPVRLRRVVGLVLNNAIEYTEKGYISLDIALSSQTDDWIELQFSFEGSGPGLGGDVIEDLLKFREADTDRTEVLDRRDLESSIVQKLVMQMNGRMWVEPLKGVGDVVRFTASFPVGDRRRYRDLAQVDPALKGKRILILDTFEISQNIYRESFSLFSEILNTANSREMALQAVRKSRIDCFVYDIKRYEKDDLEFVRTFASFENCQGPILLLVPRHALMRLKEDLSDIGSVHCMSKPMFYSDFKENIPSKVEEYLYRKSGNSKAREGRIEE